MGPACNDCYFIRIVTIIAKPKTKSDTKKSFCLCPEDDFGLWSCRRDFAVEEGGLFTIFGSILIREELIWLESSKDKMFFWLKLYLVGSPLHLQ